MSKQLVFALLCAALTLLFCLCVWTVKPLTATGISGGWALIVLCTMLSTLSTGLFGAAEIFADNWTSEDAYRVVWVSWVLITVLLIAVFRCPLVPLAVTLPFVPLSVGVFVGNVVGDGIREWRLKRSCAVRRRV